MPTSRKPAAKRSTAKRSTAKRSTAKRATPAKPAREPYAFDAAIYLNPDPGGIKTDAGGRPMTDKGGRPLTKD